MPEPLAADAVAAMDACWLEGRFEDLERLLALGVVMTTPDGAVRVEGAAALVESYREFMSRSHVQRFERSDVRVVADGETAVVESTWAMAWESGGAAHVERGREAFALIRAGGGWRVLWPLMVFAPATPS